MVDHCGNEAANQVQTITVNDNIPPTFTRPADITIFTSANCSYDASVSATGDVVNEADNCSTGLQATFTDAVTNGQCEGSKIITRTWHLVDHCGNAAANQVQTITVNDNIPPTFTRPADITVYTDADCKFDASVAVTGDVINESDNCSGSLEATYVDELADGSCEGSKIISRIWHLVDHCGNAAAEQIQTIKVLDTIAPTFTRPADVIIYSNANCEYNASIAFTHNVTDVADNCSSDIEVTFSDVVSEGSCEGSKIISRTWHVVDNCGNASADQVQTIKVIDNIAPTFTRPADITIYASENCSFDAGTEVTGYVTDVADNCSLDLQPTFTDVVMDGLCQGSKIILRTWQLMDACGNVAPGQIQTITVSDTLAPVVECPENVSVNNDPSLCGAYVTVPKPEVFDNCGSFIIVNDVNQTNDASGFYPVGVNDIRWTITDACGNVTYCMMTVTVTDNEVPVLLCPADVVSCSLDVDLGTPFVSDNCGIYSITNNAPEVFTVGLTPVVWTVTDIHGNSSSCTQMVNASDLKSTTEGTSILRCFGINDGFISVTASGGNGPYSYSLNGGSPQQSNEFANLPGGTYVVTVADANECVATSTITIENREALLVTIDGLADANCAGKNDGSIRIVVSGGAGPYQYNWSNGETTETIHNLDAGDYTVTVTDANGCELKYTQAVVPGNYEEALVINNAFSPNGDGINDYWVIKNIDLYPDNEVVVVNRWGNEIYSMKNYSNTWDGSRLSEGTYLYILKVQMCGEQKTFKGYISIIR